MNWYYQVTNLRPINGAVRRWIFGFLLCWGITTSVPAQETPTSEPAVKTIKLSQGDLLLAPGLTPKNGKITLVFHLHGATSTMTKALITSRKNYAVYTLSFPGLSDAYRKPFSDPVLFKSLLNEIETTLQKEWPAEKPTIGFLTVSSFSAGFGGVRELLKQEENLSKINAIVMADSIYAGFKEGSTNRELDPAKMEGFLKFAEAASEKKKWMIISHSEQNTPDYGSTTETADYLVEKLGISRMDATPNPWPGDLKIKTKAAIGNCQIFGFRGDTPEAHMLHLQNIWTLWQRLPNP